MKLQFPSKSPISVQIHVLLTNPLWKPNMNRIEESAPESMMLMLHLAVGAVAPVSPKNPWCAWHKPGWPANYEIHQPGFDVNSCWAIPINHNSTIMMRVTVMLFRVHPNLSSVLKVPGSSRWKQRSASDSRFHVSSAWRKAGSTSEPLASKLGGLTTMVLRRHTWSIYCKETKWILQGAFPNTCCDIWDKNFFGCATNV